MMDYLDAFQIVMVIYVTLAVGAVFGFIKFFTEESMKRVRRLLFMIPIATMLFYEIAVSPLNKTTWMTFLHALLIQVVLHLIAFAYSCFFHGTSTIIEKFILTSIALCESDFFWYGYPLTQILFTQAFNCYCATAMFVQTLCIHSIHMFLVLYFKKNSYETFNKMTEPIPDEEVPLEPKQNDHEKDQSESDKEKELPEIEEEKEVVHSDESDDKRERKVDASGNPASDSSDEKKEEKKESSSSSSPVVNVEDGKSDEKPADVAPPPEPPKKRTYSKTFWYVYSFVNQHNIAAILGICWSIAVKYTNVAMPIFLKSFNFDLEKASICAGLFCAGTFIAFHPFKGAPVLDVIVSMISHYIVKPCLAIAFCYILDIKHDVAKFLVLLNLAPTGLYAYFLSDQAGYKTSMVTYSMYWGMILVLPMYMIWIAIINETHLFA